MNDDFADQITRTIKAAAIRPRPRWAFLAGRAALRVLAGMATLFGAVSVATLIYYFTDRGRTGGQGFDAMPFDDFFEVVPYFWLAILGLAVASATLAFRASPRGYLWHPASLSALILLASLALGTIGYATGFGPALNRGLANRLPVYARLIAVEDWRTTSPDRGRLVGAALGMTESGRLLLRDFTGKEWVVDISVASVSADEPLGSPEDLDIAGTRTGLGEFTARAVTDWH